ncbi:shieldin complex subunit 1 [Mixophyes fleayi]|uniref:shieldin complex subunit 1 n=1 Tax=Mixophyes fleayi TaxID=3061075 RepID=UPI003F4E1510
MEERGPAPSQMSECSSVLDLSCTYNISDTVLQQEPSSGTWEEDLSLDLTSASSLPLQRNTGSTRNDCEEDGQSEFEDDETSLRLPHSRDAFTVTDQNNFPLTSPLKLEKTQDKKDEQIRASLDAFYERSSQTGEGDCHQLSEKIADLQKKNHLYALRSFQLGKIVLNQGGTNLLQNCHSNNVFTSQKETKSAMNIKPVPGLSKDVISFIMDREKT